MIDISMIGIDYNKASVKIREQFSLSVQQGRSFAEKIMNGYSVKGCVILSTCNRTEIWFSGLKGVPLAVLCGEKGKNPEEYQAYFVQRSGSEAVRYLFELACGIHSQIYGEDQIITQVGNALSRARDEQHIDAVLETLFRLAVTAAKKVKTDVRLTLKDTSVPGRILELLKEMHGPLKDKKCLVIGNGEIGRLMAEKLIACGCSVTMTLRQYKGKEAVIPRGCEVIRYDKRYDAIGGMDYIFSATVSPHYTVLADELRKNLKDRTYNLFDLAIPRDIQPEIRQLKNVTVYDMDSFGLEVQIDEKEQKAAQEILLKYRQEFKEWYYDRDYIPVIHQIGAAAGKLVDAKMTKEYKKTELSDVQKTQLSCSIQSAAQRSVEKLIFAAKEHMDAEQWMNCIHAFHKTLEALD